MYKNFCEIKAHKMRLWSKEVVPKKHFLPVGYCVYSTGTVFFRVLYFFVPQKWLRSTIVQWLLYFSEEHLQPWIVYIQCIWQISLFKAYCYFKGTLATIYLKVSVIIERSLLCDDINSRHSLFSIVVSLFHGKT